MGMRTPSERNRWAERGNVTRQSGPWLSRRIQLWYRSCVVAKRCTLSIDAFEDIDDDNKRRRLKADLIHRSMERLLAPLRQASENGVDIWCSDGRLRRVFPRIAAYTADWPEQNLQSCTSEGNCPICTAEWEGRGSVDKEVELRDREQALGVLRAYFLHKSVAELKQLSLKPVWPWWGDARVSN